MMQRLTVLALLMAALSAHGQSTFRPSFTAKVIHVNDGDTLVVLDSINQKTKIRLANIDAPESGHGRCRPGQPWSAQSTAFLARAVKGRDVALQCSTLDRFGRSVCDVLIADTTASRLLVGEGLAWANRAHPSYLRDRVVAKEEERARTARVGLWAAPGAVPPWEWRRSEWGTEPGCKR